MDNTSTYMGPADILVVDDTPANLRLLGGMLKEQGYKPRLVPSGKLAIQAAEDVTPDLILLDIMMPEMDGYEVCRRLKENERLRKVPVIFISALNETTDKVKAFSMGGFDYVTKPFHFEEVQARVDTHLKLHRLQLELEEHNQHLEELVRQQVKEISDSQMAAIFALAKLAESRDDDTGKHLERVQVFCKMLATGLRESSPYASEIDDAFIQNIYYASPLHDIGKVGIRDNILLKPAKLTPEEFEIMKTHAIMGAQTLEAVRTRYPRNAFVNMGIAIAHYHHEKWNGSGYPEGLVGAGTPLCARIMAVADVYDALRSRRHYKPAFPHEQSRQIIMQDSGSHFDPHIVRVFDILHEEFSKVRDGMEG